METVFAWSSGFAEDVLATVADDSAAAAASDEYDLGATSSGLHRAAPDGKLVEPEVEQRDNPEPHVRQPAYVPTQAEKAKHGVTSYLRTC